MIDKRLRWNQRNQTAKHTRKSLKKRKRESLKNRKTKLHNLADLIIIKALTLVQDGQKTWRRLPFVWIGRPHRSLCKCNACESFRRWANFVDLWRTESVWPETGHSSTALMHCNCKRADPAVQFAQAPLLWYSCPQEANYIMKNVCFFNWIHATIICNMNAFSLATSFS